MCGIVAYVGEKQAYPILLKGLQRLEYRGYDSAGVALLNGHLRIYKCKGKVSDLKAHVNGTIKEGTLGMGHTRWATHGAPNDVNAHPHLSESKNLAIIHNGIIENYASLKEELIQRGFTFKTETDTEVLINLIEDIQQKEAIDLEHAVRVALNQVVGAYAIVVMSKDNPDTLIAAKKSSPLVIGIGKDEYFLASDATPIIEYTKNVVYLEDEEMAIITKGEDIVMKTIQNQPVTPYIEELQMNLETLEKGGYDHFMLKEIFEQPQSIYDSLRGRMSSKDGTILLGGIKDYLQKWHSGLVAEYLFEDLARIPVEVEYASEFRYRNPVIYEDDIVIAISQSGETADTLAALELAKSKGATVIGICNVVGSTIARKTDAGCYTHAGPEIGVASTKAFTAQLSVLSLMALYIAEARGSITESRYRGFLNALAQIPEKVEQVLQKNEVIKTIAEKYKDAKNCLYLGRGYNFPVALEGALKFKEITYVHAEGYPAAEMKHGPIALIDEQMPVVVIATNESAYEKIVSNIQEVKARKGNIIAVVTEGDTQIKEIADFTIEIPPTIEELTPILSVVALQLLAYHTAVFLGCHVDQPRNLAKSVTVE